MQKNKIQGILPLSFMQQALLFHSLSTKNDQGILHVECILNGKLDRNCFQKSWEAVVKRHEIFRTSIHWEKLEKPLQVIHPNVAVSIAFEDCQGLSKKQQLDRIKEYKKTDRQEGLLLSKNPVYRLALFQNTSDQYIFIWTCHHILLDGWSASNVVKDIFEFYEGYLKDIKTNLEPVPSFKAYLKDFQSSDSDSDSDERFWKNELANFKQASLVSEDSKMKSGKYAFEYQVFNEQLTQSFKDIAKQHRLTLNTLLQGIWSTLLAAHTRKEDVVFGTTVSVRSNQFENSDLMVGLFTNMLPVRMRIENDLSFVEQLVKFQNQQGTARNHQQVSLNQILNWTEWPGASPFFDHLLVVENFPWKDFKKGGITVQGFKSGITTTYPLTLIIKPLKTTTFIFQYDEEKVSKRTISWFSSALKTLIHRFVANPQDSVGSLLEGIELLTLNDKVAVTDRGGRDKQMVNTEGKVRELIVPNTPLELKLTKIWQEVFGYLDISVLDNFFEIGGKSILAIRLFAKIQKQLGYNISPITILQYPSIRDLAIFMNKEETNTGWRSLVPLKTNGKKMPIFCLHAKGGYVFFYNHLANYMDENQPVYALQPRGLDGVEPLYDSIEEMAKSYIDEILTIQPKGPYALLATCFSNAVGYEMAQQLKKMGHEISLLAMIDAAPGTQMETMLNGKKDTLLSKVVRNYKKRSIVENGKIAVSKILQVGKKELLLSNQEKSLLEVQKKLSHIFYKYQRKPYDGEITLIRSSEFEGRSDKNFHIKEWKNLVAETNLKVVVVPGRHQTMFIEPEVQVLAKELKKCLNFSKDGLQ